VTHKVLDAWAVMAWLEGETPARKRVSALFAAASEQRVALSISMINVGEIFYSIAKRRSAPAAEEFLAELATFPVAIVTPGRKQILEAARLKARFPISYADAFAMQAAIEVEAPLVTGDHEIRDVSARAGLRLDWIAAPRQ
jgi:predicted nucleic acid-binding protein